MTKKSRAEATPPRESERIIHPMCRVNPAASGSRWLGRPRAYLAATTDVIFTDSFAGVVFATVAAADDSVLAMPQQLAAGTTIVEETIVSQQAARRQTSRPQQS